VLYAAVGRRLDYPLRLVRAKGRDYTHCFVRWEGANGGHFNIETTGQGLSCPRDDYYRTGRYEIDPKVEKEGLFLRSLTPRQELANFLMERGHCWRELGNFRRAAEAFAWASGLVPDNALIRSSLTHLTNAWLRRVEARRPPRMPTLVLESPFRRFPPAVSLKVERRIFSLEAMENLLQTEDFRRRWWEPQERGETVRDVPAEALARFDPKGGCRIHLRWSTSHN
jgi:hypothetical protein